MTLGEAAAVLRYLTSSYPTQALSPESATVWRDQVLVVDVDDAQEAARAAVAGDQWFPTVARFRELARSAQRSRESHEARPALPAPRPDNAARMAVLRRQLAHVGTGAPVEGPPHAGDHDDPGISSTCPGCRHFAGLVAEEQQRRAEATRGAA